MPSWDFDVLPKLDWGQGPPDAPPAGKSAEEYREYIATISYKTQDVLTYLDKWKNIYIPNILGYSDPNVFSPELHGWNWLLVERGAFYTLAAKWFLYLVVSLSFINLWALGYFHTVIPEENPRSLNNRINDKFLSTKGHYLKKKNARGFGCLVFGFIVSIVMLAFTYATVTQNRKFFAIASRYLTESANKSIQDVKNFSLKVKKINDQKLVIPSALHRGETVVLIDQFSKINSHNKQLLKKVETFNKVIIDQSPLVAQGPLWNMVLYSIIFGISILAWFRKFKGVNFVAYFILIFVCSNQILVCGDILRG